MVGSSSRTSQFNLLGSYRIINLHAVEGQKYSIITGRKNRAKLSTSPRFLNDSKTGNTNIRHENQFLFDE